MAKGGVRAASAAEVAALIASAQPDELEKLCARYEEDPRQQVRRAVATGRRRMAAGQAELARVRELYELMNELSSGGVALGVDEVGRGAVAGPLMVAAVALPREPMVLGINDSKQLSPRRRRTLASRIFDTALAIGIAQVEPQVIDEVGMARALRQAMAEAIADSGIEPDAVLIDGNPVHVHPKERCVVKGDARIACIAAASIVAKVTRDELMVALDNEYPGYRFAKNKGYASSEHIDAIRRLGLSDVHRVSFCGNFSQMEMTW